MIVDLSEVIISVVMHVHVLLKWLLLHRLEGRSHLSFTGLEKPWLAGHLLISEKADVALHSRYQLRLLD